MYSYFIFWLRPERRETHRFAPEEAGSSAGEARGVYVPACCEPDYLAAFRVISASMVMVTSSPTTTPPLSMVAFHFTPKSWRLILVVALMAMRWLPQGSLTGAVGPSTSN